MAKKKTGEQGLLAAKRDAKRAAIDPLDPNRVRNAIEVLYNAQAAYAEEVAQVKRKGMMPQKLIAIAHTAAQVQTVMMDMQSAFMERAKAMRETGRFEQGAFGVEFKLVAGRRTPQWKEEATARAAALAAERGKKFNAKKYQQRVLDAAPKAEDSFRAEIVVRDKS